MFKSKTPAKDSFVLPSRAITVSFAVVILVGTLLLMLPISAKSGEVTPFVDSLFTATSATCVTGLVVYDTFNHWTVFGQLIILMLIQIGGLGFITFTTFFNIILGRKLGLRSMQLAQESISSTGFNDINKLIRMVVIVSLAIEAIGAVLLSFVFIPKYGFGGIFISIFLAVSAFCNAGFDVLGFETPFISLMNYADNPIVLFTIMALIVVGGLGFVVWWDLYHWLKMKKLTLHTRVVLTGTIILITIGTLVFLFAEWNNPQTLGAVEPAFKPINALFQSITLRTAGFNTIDMVNLHDSTKIISGIIMLIGAAPGSTAGGVKITTITVIIMTIICVIYGYEDTIIWKRRVSKSAVYKALTIIMIAILAISVSCFVTVTVLEKDGILITGTDAFFEAASAYATVGLSVGVTAVLNTVSKIGYIILMFLGRVGAVSFALSLAMRTPPSKNIMIPDGNIMVG